MIQTQTVLFCHGCNEKFAVAADEHACPQCGLTLAMLAEAPTQDFVDLAARGTYVIGTEKTPDNDDELIGRRISTYLIESFLGKGGMARVYRALHEMLERPCAIKVLNRQLVERDPDYLRMFFAEARSAASLVHPHVVTIHTIGHDEGLHFIEMEHVAGRSLHRFAESRGRLDATLATSLMLQTCSALAAAHRVGMIHRDVKPANVLVTEDGVAKLADFGLAKRVVSSDSPAGGRTLAGTPYYMAPELFDGQPADKRSDVYAMGVTYFYLLSGRLPFVHQSVPQLARMHAAQPVPDIQQLRPDVPADTVAVVRRCLAKDAADRYADAGELLYDLKAVFGGLQSLECLVREAISGLQLELQGSGDRFCTNVRLTSGRSQKVTIEACCGGTIADRVVKIYSVCGPACDGFFRRALELNAVIPHGSIALEQIDGQPHFIMGNTYPRVSCDPEEIRRSVLTIAQHADDVERCLHDGDQH